jgi:nicotinamidase/pyrazinamidase
MRALLLVDIQNDFCPGGALPVAAGDDVVLVANRLIPCFDVVLATMDWHPADHGSFAINHPGKRPFEIGELAGMPQVLWPIHCVQDTPGAALHPGLQASAIHCVLRKGTDPVVDSYSAFFDNGRRKSTGLYDILRLRDVDDVVVMGLATDYCVRATVLDALDLKLRATVVADGCRAVELKPGDGQRAMDEMHKAGAQIVCSDTLTNGPFTLTDRT